MSFRTRQSLSGFIASDPGLTYTVNGDARLHVRIGQPHFRRNTDGTFTELDPSFHSLVQYGRSAEHAYAVLRKGDRFVAEGHIRTYEYVLDGEQKTTEQFIATKIGHDTARSTYIIDRSTDAEQAGCHAPQPDARAVRDDSATHEAIASSGRHDRQVAELEGTDTEPPRMPARVPASTLELDRDRPPSL